MTIRETNVELLLAMLLLGRLRLAASRNAADSDTLPPPSLSISGIPPPTPSVSGGPLPPPPALLVDAFDVPGSLPFSGPSVLTDVRGSLARSCESSVLLLLAMAVAAGVVLRVAPAEVVVEVAAPAADDVDAAAVDVVVVALEAAAPDAAADWASDPNRNACFGEGRAGRPRYLTASIDSFVPAVGGTGAVESGFAFAGGDSAGCGTGEASRMSSRSVYVPGYLASAVRSAAVGGLRGNARLRRPKRRTRRPRDG